MYYHGDDVEQNNAEALEMFKQAHNAGHARATFSLGLMYRSGDGVEQNKAEALELFKQGHAAAHASATYRAEQCRSVRAVQAGARRRGCQRDIQVGLDVLRRR